jgi:hypothetical protein
VQALSAATSSQAAGAGIAREVGKRVAAAGELGVKPYEPVIGLAPCRAHILNESNSDVLQLEIAPEQDA